jgi:DNA-binding transcriptional ArsR family regulator
MFRSTQEARMLAWLFDNPSREIGVSALARKLGIPQPTVSRDLRRAERAGLLESRQVGRNKLIRVRTDSVFYEPLRTILVRAYGAPQRLYSVLHPIHGIEQAFIYGSWAASFLGVTGTRVVGDIDVLVLGEPSENDVYKAVSSLADELGYEIQVTFRPSKWLTEGTGSFHDTVVSRPMVDIIANQDLDKNLDATSTASSAHA